MILETYSLEEHMVLEKKEIQTKQNKKECSQINPHTCGHLIFDTGSKYMQWAKSLFNK